VLGALACSLLSLAPSPRDYFDIVSLAPDVYGVIRKEPGGLSLDSNVVFIVNQEDVVMVDANIGPESATATLAALKEITDKPVRYVINTHYHDDHIGGNATVRTAFPGVDFIGAATIRENLQKYSLASRKEMIEGAPAMAKMLRDLMGEGKSLSGKAIADDEKTAYESDIRIAERYGREMPTVEIIPPTIEVTDRLILHRGDRIIEILNLGSGHTSSDLVVHLPKEKIAIVGDLVVWPAPLAGNPQSHIHEWGDTLDRVMALKAETIVPGHGPVMHDDGYLKLLARFYRSAAEQATAAFKRGESVEDATKKITLEEFEKAFCGDSEFRKTLFLYYGRVPSIQGAYREAKEKGV
jgi:glyoxylase-like metal-dependent hydrolase (beta-lactamase superfamily II)